MTPIPHANDHDHVIVDRCEHFSWARLIYSDGLIAWVFWIPFPGGIRRPFGNVCIETLALSEPTTRRHIARTLREVRSAQRIRRQSLHAASLQMRRRGDSLADGTADLPMDYPTLNIDERRTKPAVNWIRRPR